MEKFEFKNIPSSKKEYATKYSDYNIDNDLFIDFTGNNVIDYPPRIVRNPVNNCQMGSIGGADACKTIEDFISFIKEFKKKVMKNMVLMDVTPSTFLVIKNLYKDYPNDIKVSEEYISTRGSRRVLVLASVMSPIFNIS